MGWNPFARAAAPAPRREPRLRLPSTGALRDFTAGTVDLLTADFPALARSGNASLRPALRTMRARSRQLAENNDYMREFLRTLVKKVLGADGIRLTVRAMRDDKVTVDQADSDYLEAQFAEWAKVGTCTVCGRYSFADVQRLALTSAARDGELLVRIVRGFPNRWGLALQLIESDVLDENLNVAAGAGFGGIDKPLENEIRMGVERDQWGRVAAYHILTRHPGDDLGYRQGGTRYERLPARDVIHFFLPDRIDDARGAPWAWTAIRRLHMTGGYEEAELVAARLGASKGGFYETESGDELTGDGEDGDGNLIHDATPGQFERLPVGVKFKAYDPQHPSGNFGPFMKAILRGAAAGVGMSYNALAKDLEGVNYSSLRQGELDDREQWRLLQGLAINKLCAPVYSAWLDMGLLTGGIALPPSKRAKFDSAVWHPRGWPWVDPTKDIAADQEAVAMGVKSLTQVCAERGVDFEDVLRERKRELALAKQYGVELVLGKPATPPPAKPAPVDDEQQQETLP